VLTIRHTVADEAEADHMDASPPTRTTATTTVSYERGSSSMLTRAASEPGAHPHDTQDFVLRNDAGTPIQNRLDHMIPLQIRGYSTCWSVTPTALWQKDSFHRLRTTGLALPSRDSSHRPLRNHSSRAGCLPQAIVNLGVCCDITTI
jgi:hypothetical protein